MLTTFQKPAKGQWSSHHLEHKEERERMSNTRDEFEARSKYSLRMLAFLREGNRHGEIEDGYTSKPTESEQRI
jgi:hypothetical protein